jgi:hypothetical protein
MTDFEDDFATMPDPTASSATSIASALSFADFVAYAPSRACIYLPCKAPWPNASVDRRLPDQVLLDASGQPVLNKKGKVVMIPASEWLEKNQSVEAMTWIPGEPEFIRDKLAVEGGWVSRPGATTLNTYRPPVIELGDAAKAQRWVDHWYALYPDEADHQIGWLAHRVQRPEVKINHGLLIGGAPGIGKDTLLAGVRMAVGEWNYRDITLTHLVSKNNDFLRAVILRLNEVRDVGEQGTVDRYRLYDHMKDMLATPPETIRVNIKYVPEFYIFNRVGVVMTTNYRDALYLPADDRRHHVAFSECRTEEFPPEFWNDFWTWYKEDGGFKHVAAYLYQYDLSSFDPGAPPPKTPAFWYMVGADRSDVFSELMNTISELGKPVLGDPKAPNTPPEALTINQLVQKAPGLDWLQDLKTRRLVRKRLEDCGYVAATNPDADDGLWVIKKKRQAIYARANLGVKQRCDAARKLRAELDV